MNNRETRNSKIMKKYYCLYLDFLTEQIRDTTDEIQATHKQDDFDLLNLLLEEFSVAVQAYAGEF